MSLPTEHLLDRARQGDVEAFATVFEQFRPLLYRIACRVVGVDDGEDVVMDTYLKAWKAIPRFRGDAALRSWLCTATRNCALDCLRRRRRDDERRVHDAGATDDETPLLDRVADPRAESADRHAERADVGGELAAALGQLSGDHRVTLLLREVDGLSYKEVAAATGVSIGTVMSRLFYAKHRLRKLLRQKESAMSTDRDQAFKKALYEAAALPEPRPATAFWQDFRARASLTVQQTPEQAAVQEGTLLSLRWASAALALLLVLGAAAVYLHPWARPVQVAVVPAVQPAIQPSMLSKVEEVEVLSEYSSVMIVEDAENGGTVIWVASADSPRLP